MYTSTFAYMVIVALPDAQAAANVATLLFSLILIFNGVLQTPGALPGFWIFMWRVSPFTYLIAGMTGTGLQGRPVHCLQDELAIFNPSSGQTCQRYLEPYFQLGAPGYLTNPSSTSNCEYCSFTNADQYLALSRIDPSDRYRNLGIGFGFILFNIVAAIMLYYLFRVRRVSFGTLAKLADRFKRLMLPRSRPKYAQMKAQGEQTTTVVPQ